MSRVQVFFSRPAGGPSQETVQSRMRQDLAGACRRAAIVSAWFTDAEIAAALIAAPAPRCCKFAILNRADLTRDRKTRAVPLLKEYFTRTRDEVTAAHWGPVEQVQVGRRAHGLESDGRLVVLGSADWVEGVMHHKMVLTDNIVWTGSYNLTYAARRNYETLLRFDDPAIAAHFWKELDHLAGDDELWEAGQGSQFQHHDGRFRCCQCYALKAAADLWDHQAGTNMLCQACGEKEEAGRGRLGLADRWARALAPLPDLPEIPF